jgi:E3 ubiquitin-protein ligase CBL
MAQAVATNFRRRILGGRQDSSNDLAINSNSYLNRSSIRIDRRVIEKVWKQMDRIVKYCQMPKMNLINSPPYILDILPELYQILREIINNYEDRLHILNDIEYFRIFIDNLIEQCTKTIDCFKRAGHHMYDEQSTQRKYLIKLSLYFSHNLAELKSLFNKGIYEGEKFRLTKQEATEFWKNNFNERYENYHPMLYHYYDLF